MHSRVPGVLGLVSKLEAARIEAADEDKWDPWADVGEGSHLHIGHFLTFQLTRLANLAKLNVTGRYLADVGLKGAEWRLLAMTMRFQPLTFSQLVTYSSMDKGQASRTVRGLIRRGYVTNKSHPPRNRKGNGASLTIILRATPKGRALYEAVLPVAQRRQARLLQQLTRDERRTLFKVLGILRSAIGTDGEPELSRQIEVGAGPRRNGEAHMAGTGD
jgi:DNA-binding MarR family transcriptional regulator